MTPAAMTPAGRAAQKKRSPTRATTSTRAAKASRAAAEAVPGHRRSVRPKAAPKVPRRVSGPLRGRVSVRPPAAPRPRPRPRRQTRSGQRTRVATPLHARAAAFVRALPDSALLDRLIRGRAWIPLLGVMLAGIVAMQVEVLKLGTSIGRSIERSATLQTRNDQLRMSVAALDGDERIERLAAAHGMIMPASDQIGFLSYSRSPALVGHAVDSIHSPDASSFLSLSSSNGGIATVASSQAAASALATGASALSGTTDTSSASVSASASSASTSSSSSTSGGAGIPVGG